jgi:hypothetical protein
MDMDQAELDAAHDQAFYAPLRAQIAKRRASNSECHPGRANGTKSSIVSSHSSR